MQSATVHSTVPTHIQYHYRIPLLTHSLTASCVGHTSCAEAVPATQHHMQVMDVSGASDPSPHNHITHMPAWLTWTVMTLSLERQSRTPLDNPSLPETWNKMVGSQKLVVGAILLTQWQVWHKEGKKPSSKKSLLNRATKTDREVQVHVQLTLDADEWRLHAPNAPSGQEMGGLPECMDIVMNRKITAPTKDQTSVVYHVAYSLHWLSYSCTTIAEASSIFTWFLDDL
jgi:hypothetical protein